MPDEKCIISYNGDRNLRIIGFLLPGMRANEQHKGPSYGGIGPRRLCDDKQGKLRLRRADCDYTQSVQSRRRKRPPSISAMLRDTIL